MCILHLSACRTAKIVYESLLVILRYAFIFGHILSIFRPYEKQICLMHFLPHLFSKTFNIFCLEMLFQLRESISFSGGKDYIPYFEYIHFFQVIKITIRHESYQNITLSSKCLIKDTISKVNLSIFAYILVKRTL